jgi:NADPH:quinone reductase-like Zn-dependent oxidoreductase
MRAAIQRSFGGAEAVGIEEVPDPECGPADALIAVRACALNRLDLLQRDGPPVVPNFSLPHIAGMDVAGEVVALGTRAEGVAVGDSVVLDPVVRCGHCARCTSGREAYCENLRTVGSTRPGGYAELVAVPARNCFASPAGLSAVEAAAVPVAAITAWHCLVRVGRLQAGETMLVHGAGSGVTTAAVAFAKGIGARVITTASSPAKAARAAELGADVVVDRSAEPWLAPVLDATGGEGVDLVFDHVGPAVFEESIRALRIEGRMVFAGTTTGDRVSFPLTAVYHGGRSLLGAGGWRASDFAAMLGDYARYAIRPVVDSVWPFDELAAAQARLGSGEFFGKVVLSVPS